MIKVKLLKFWIFYKRIKWIFFEKQAQYYKELVAGISNMGVNILLDPKNTMALERRFMNFDFSKIISLTF